VKRVLGVLAFALVLAFGFGDREEPPAAGPAVPLAISETTVPPGWTRPAVPVESVLEPEPATPEEQIVAWLGELGHDAPWHIGGGLVLLGIVAALVIGLEKSRTQ
jgi:hypothetical protein